MITFVYSVATSQPSSVIGSLQGAIALYKGNINLHPYVTVYDLTDVCKILPILVGWRLRHSLLTQGLHCTILPHSIRQSLGVSIT